MNIENFPKPHTPDSLSIENKNNSEPTAEEIVWGTAEDQQVRKHEILQQLGIQKETNDFSEGNSAPRDHFMTPGENTDF